MSLRREASRHIELPACHWMLRMSHKSVGQAFQDGRPLQRLVDEIYFRTKSVRDFPLWCVKYDAVFWS